MASLQVRWPEMSGTKQKAVDDATKMQKRVIEDCNKLGKEVPPYQLSELIGKGSYGRVYKASDVKSKKMVAVKIIDIDQSDTMDPRSADTYSDLLKEINALQRLSQSGARNVNTVIETLPVAQSMWMITEYCAGGSVATLMRPTSPGGLQEKWIIPILREVAEALYWVHGQGIIHRDLKCANVLVTETGDVQLCDFGVAGVIETKFDKRTTVIGTPHWMAPELFDNTASYGTEVDIWAYGAMVYEIASGLPPNTHAGMDFVKLGNILKQNAPRLEGDQYSSGLKDLIGFCLQADPRKRPPINQIQRHGYIFKTDDAYPTSALSHLVRGFKLWESQGGARKSLFGIGGAQAPEDLSDLDLANDEWNFSTTAAFDQQVFNDGGAQDVYDVYGSNVEFGQESYEDTARAQQKTAKGRRRPPPQLPSVKVPLEKLFDPNTISSYEDNSRTYYGRLFPAPVSDLPLRDDSTPSAGADVRESLIDLDASLHGGDLSNFVDMNTIRAGDSRMDYDDYGDSQDSYDDGPSSDPADLGPKADRRTQDWKFPTAPAPATAAPDLNGGPSSDPADIGPKPDRRTQDWTFPTAPAPASAQPDVFRFPASDAPPANPAEFKFPMSDDPTPNAGRPSLIHRPTEPIPASATFNDLAPAQPPNMDQRASLGSLIDLDMSMPEPPFADFTRPSTSHSEAGSVSGSEFGNNPFELEKHASVYAAPSAYREPSIYVSDDSEFSSNTIIDLNINGDFNSDHPKEIRNIPEEPPDSARPYSLSEFADMDPEDMDGPTPTPNHPQDLAYFPPSIPQQNLQKQLDQPLHLDGPALPMTPLHPAQTVLQGQASSREVKEELRRMAMSLGDHLSHANMYMSGLPVRRGSSTRLDSAQDAL